MSIVTVLGLTEDALVGTTSSSEYSSEGGTPTFDRIPFRVKAGRRPNLNTFVIALRQGDDRRAHYGRIIAGSELNLRARPGGMQKDDAYGMQRTDIRSSELSPDLVRVMEIELLGEICVKDENSLEIAEPSQLPHTGQPVYELPATIIPKLLNIPEKDDDANDKPTSTSGLYLGKIESGGYSVPFFLPNTAIARHVAVLGKTGVGKSYAVGVLMEELYEKRIPILSFDVLGDNEQTAKDLKGVHIQAGTDQFRVPYSIIGIEEFLPFIPGLTERHREVIGEAYMKVFYEAWEQLDGGRVPDLQWEALYEEMREVGPNITDQATVNRAITRVQSVARRTALLTAGEVEWAKYLTEMPFVNIYVGALGQEQRNLVVGATARILQRLRRRNHIPPFVLVIDEAHLFLPGGIDPPPSTRVLREMIRTARHDSVGVVLLSQSPSSMDRQILLTCNTRMLFALDPEDLRVVAGQIGDLPEETIKRIPRMPRGTAVFTSGMDIMRHAVIVKIRERTFTTHVAETPDLREAVEKWRKDHQTHQNSNK
ncbi:ATP-binding protein [Synechococcus sp. R8-2]|uniref:ATP-binding protein n=1 Tax=Synechococcus sp. R8-2 TaxID=2291959 RepID=UPI0039C1A7E6